MAHSQRFVDKMYSAFPARISEPTSPTGLNPTFRAGRLGGAEDSRENGVDMFGMVGEIE